MKAILILYIIVFFIGCSVSPQLQKESVQDLVSIPQDIKFYTSKLYSKVYSFDNNYTDKYFKIWNIKKPIETIKDIQWPFQYFAKKNNYSDNLLPIKKDYFSKMLIESQFKNYLSISKKGLTLRYTHIRALPTSRALLANPSLAGEGFPFDYLQNSSINANVPIFISHYSKSKKWVYVFSNFTHGWIPTNDMVYMDDKDVNRWKEQEHFYVLQEGITLYTESGEALFDTRIGMLFPVLAVEKNRYKVQTVSGYINNTPVYHVSYIDKNALSEKVLDINAKNINTLIREVSKTHYGWGGLFEQRDCSSMLMDFYVPFGIYLPRNSSKQALVGEVIDLSQMNDSLKIRTIKEKAIPFETLLYKKGHIVLYVGTYKDNIIIFHNTWGIKTKNNGVEGRYIIGRTVFSTLKFGDELENYDESAELLRNIKSMNILTR